jgi:SLOG cluster2/ATPase family associated with various cellular activities (AAA)
MATKEEEAFKLVNIEYDAADLLLDQKDPKRHYKDVPDIGLAPFGALIPLDDDEREQLKSMRDQIAKYIKLKGHARPLCLAVFGPPGSGKTFSVKEIGNEVNKILSAGLSPQLSKMTTINLTQLSNPTELTATLVTTFVGSLETEGTVPFIFFDEFDTARDGAPYGWLGSFLAPMHDGEFVHGGKIIKIKKVVYMFAGGTASTQHQFTSRQNESEFRAAKGPDFVSRLRGFLDVRGPNADRRALRRALVLRHEMAERVKREGKGVHKFEPELLKALLGAGRYRHGARSIAALIEHADLGKKPLDWDMLPEKHILAMHVDRGPLDREAIGGCIALSGYKPLPLDDLAAGQKPGHLKECWDAVAGGLWDEGATLAYAGQWRSESDGTNLLKALIEKLRGRPPELSSAAAVRAAPAARFIGFIGGVDPSVTREQVNAIIDKQEQKRLGVMLVEDNYLDQEETGWKASDDAHKWRARAVERFRRRWAVSEESVARFVIGGVRETGGDRPSGVVDETIHSLALGRPVYLAGGFGGSSEDIGVLLGLTKFRTASVPKSLTLPMRPELCLALGEIASRLRPPPYLSLPVSPHEQIQFLQQHALGGSKWPDNGLSSEENRKLFASDNPEVVKDLVIGGLRRLFDPPLFAGDSRSRRF